MGPEVGENTSYWLVGQRGPHIGVGTQRLIPTRYVLRRRWQAVHCKETAWESLIVDKNTLIIM